jgi:hypothetical protein
MDFSNSTSLPSSKSPIPPAIFSGTSNTCFQDLGFGRRSLGRMHKRINWQPAQPTFKLPERNLDCRWLTSSNQACTNRQSWMYLLNHNGQQSIEKRSSLEVHLQHQHCKKKKDCVLLMTTYSTRSDATVVPRKIQSTDSSQSTSRFKIRIKSVKMILSTLTNRLDFSIWEKNQTGSAVMLPMVAASPVLPLGNSQVAPTKEAFIHCNSLEFGFTAESLFRCVNWCKFHSC